MPRRGTPIGNSGGSGDWRSYRLAPFGLSVTEGAEALGVSRVALSRPVTRKKGISPQPSARQRNRRHALPSPSGGVNTAILNVASLSVFMDSCRFGVRQAEDIAEKLLSNPNLRDSGRIDRRFEGSAAACINAPRRF